MQMRCQAILKPEQPNRTCLRNLLCADRQGQSSDYSK
jgi:hypothetical protein